MVLLSAEKGLKAEDIASIVRESYITVLRWLKRYMAEGIQRLMDNPRPGRNTTVIEAYRERLKEVVRRRPRSLGLEYSMWTLHRLADYLAEETKLRVSNETVRREQAKEDIVFSQPQHTISSPDPEYQVKKGDRRNPRQAEARRCILLCRRFQCELVTHLAGHVESQRATGDDPHPRPTQGTLWVRRGQLSYGRNGGDHSQAQAPSGSSRVAASFTG